MKIVRLPSGQRAFSMVELLVVIGVLGLLAVVLFVAGPASPKAKSRAQRINCVSNLKLTGMAFRLWSDDHSAYPMRFRTNNFDGPSYAIQQKMYVYFQAMSNELNTPKILTCPADDRLPATNFAELRNRNISYFVGLDADETMPQLFLAGDCDLTINGIPATNGLVLINLSNSIGWTMNRHHGEGNVELADGSVQEYTQSALRKALRNTGTNLTRLELP